MNEEQSPASNKRWMRFSITTLLVLVTAICCLFAAERYGYQRALRSSPATYLQNLDEQGLIEAAQESRKVFADKLLVPDENIRAKYESFTGKEDSGVNRILERGVFDDKGMLPRGGGAYFSFVTKSNDYNSNPQIQLVKGRFSSGFAGGDFGVVQVIPGKSIESISIDDLPEPFVNASAGQFESYRNRPGTYSQKLPMSVIYLLFVQSNGINTIQLPRFKSSTRTNTEQQSFGKNLSHSLSPGRIPGS